MVCAQKRYYNTHRPAEEACGENCPVAGDEALERFRATTAAQFAGPIGRYDIRIAYSNASLSYQCLPGMNSTVYPQKWRSEFVHPQVTQLVRH